MTIGGGKLKSMQSHPYIRKKSSGEINFRLFHFACVCFLFFDFAVSAQISALPLKPKPEEYFFEEVKFSGGASIRDVSDLQEDRRGFIWLASKHGLIRYDGHDFKVFRHVLNDNKSIIDTELLSLHLYCDSILCIGGIHGISLMDIHTEKITSLTYDQDGNPIKYVNEFFSDSDGIIWIAALNGLYSLKPDLSGIINHHLNTPPITKSNPAFAKRVYCITENSTDSNLLMLGAYYGLIAFDKKRNTVHKIYPNTQITYDRSILPIYKIVKEGDYLWTKSWMSGIPRFDMRKEQWKNFLYPDKKNNTNLFSISDLMLKDNKEIWLLDWDSGVYLFDKKTKQRRPLKETQSCPVMKKTKMKIFMQADSALWLANDEGLWRQNRRKGQFRTLNIPYYYTWIMPVLHDKTSGNYYFGMVYKTYGVACWNENTKKWNYLQTQFDKMKELNVYDIFKDHNGVIWMATGERGLWYLDKKNNLLKPFLLTDGKPLKVADATLYKVFEDSRRNLWLGTGKKGVVRINPQRTEARYYRNIPDDSTTLIDGTHFRTIAAGDTYAIVKDTTGAMWLTIDGQGLVRIDEKPKGEFHIKTYRTDEGLKDLSVRYMTKDPQGNLWIVNNGLLYFNPYDESFMLTDDRNGLQENLGGDARINFDSHGNLFCSNQVEVDWLEKIKKLSVSKISNLIIETVLVNGEPFDRKADDDEPFSLSAIDNQNNISFRYTAICFDEYDQVRYRYKLEGLEKDWNPPTRDLEARYTNLSPGKYRFLVDVAYKGIWSGYNRQIRFEIRQVFWKTWWFITCLALTVAVILYAIDDVGSTLSSISIMSDLLQADPAGEIDTRQMIREIGTNAQNMLESMDDIIWSVIPTNDEFRNLILRIHEYAIPLFESKNIRFTVNVPESLNSLSVPMEKRHNIFLIIKEAVNNLVKYSECTETVIDFSYSHSILRITVSDNGKGFNTEPDNNRNGLRNMKFRAEKIGGRLSIRSASGKGTDIRLTVRID